jgi:hypothetical protein
MTQQTTQSRVSRFFSAKVAHGGLDGGIFMMAVLRMLGYRLD